MPTYVYRCRTCSREFEEVQKFSDETLVLCPSCLKNTLVRVIGGSGLVFKGSGFYQTDYKKKLTDPDEKKPDSEKKPAPEKKPDSKPETKSEPTSTPPPKTPDPPKSDS